MSDLVADAEDLLLKLGGAADPQVRALKDRVEASVADMKAQLRQRVKSAAEVHDPVIDMVASAVEEHAGLLAMAVAAGVLVYGLSRRSSPAPRARPAGRRGRP